MHQNLAYFLLMKIRRVTIKDIGRKEYIKIRLRLKNWGSNDNFMKLNCQVNLDVMVEMVICLG